MKVCGSVAMVWANKAFKLSLAERLPMPAIFCRADSPELDEPPDDDWPAED